MKIAVKPVGLLCIFHILRCVRRVIVTANTPERRSKETETRHERESLFVEIFRPPAFLRKTNDRYNAIVPDCDGYTLLFYKRNHIRSRIKHPTILSRMKATRNSNRTNDPLDLATRVNSFASFSTISFVNLDSAHNLFFQHVLYVNDGIDVCRT